MILNKPANTYIQTTMHVSQYAAKECVIVRTYVDVWWFLSE